MLGLCYTFSLPATVWCTGVIESLVFLSIYICMLRLANNGNINLARNIYFIYIQAYAVNWEKSGCLHHKSCLFEIKPLDPH